MNPQFPIYIVSKGRHESRLTSKALEAMHTPYFIIVERQEFDAYAAVIDPSKILILDPAFQRDYDDCINDGKSKGSGPARNYAWAHSMSIGAKWHWCIDDNIRTFHRLFENKKQYVGDGTIFRCMEDFVLRYRNIAMAGPHYHTFAHQRELLPPFTLNTRIYSCNLIRNDVPFRWRCRYNEDTDLSLRMLKAGWCTVLFYAFLQNKQQTGTMKGGNEEIYAKGTLGKSRMLVNLHPDCARLTYKFKRIHHHVDYKRFTQKLVKRTGVTVPEGAYNYGMELRKI